MIAATNTCRSSRGARLDRVLAAYRVSCFAAARPLLRRSGVVMRTRVGSHKARTCVLVPIVEGHSRDIALPHCAVVLLVLGRAVPEHRIRHFCARTQRRR